MGAYQSTLNVLYQQALSKYNQKTAIVYDNTKISYETLRRGSNRVANALIQHGVQRNTRVAIMLDNCLEYSLSDLGVILAGGTTVRMNDMLGEKEIEYILNDSNAEVVLMGETFFARYEQIKDRLPHVRLVVAISETGNIPDGCMSWERFQGNQTEDNVEITVEPTDMCGIYYTGGTTGLPKGVIHDHQSLVEVLKTHLYEMEIHHDEKILLTTPLPHSAGIVLLAGLLKGAEHWIEKKFDPDLVIKRIIENRITFTFMVPTMLYRILDKANKQHDYRSLRTIVYGASPISPERLTQGLEVFGPVFLQIFGQTEAPNLITKLRKEDHHVQHASLPDILLSCGQPTLTSVVKIVDENGNELPVNEVGEIIAKTSFNMKRYHGKPNETEETIRDGWLYTGDIGRLDEHGYLYLLDRKKDMIITGGMNVYSTEVENVILEHPGVKLVSVIGVPHDDWGEAVMAIVVPNEEGPVTEEEIAEHCKQLTTYKRPKIVEITDSIPLTPYGKIDKKALRDIYWESKDRTIH